MPVFDFRCGRCKAESEVIVLPGEKTPVKCSECGGALKRRYTRVGINLSGWGFSKTDALVPEGPNRKDFKTIRDKASELFD